MKFEEQLGNLLTVTPPGGEARIQTQVSLILWDSLSTYSALPSFNKGWTIRIQNDLASFSHHLGQIFESSTYFPSQKSPVSWQHRSQEQGAPGPPLPKGHQSQGWTVDALTSVLPAVHL